MRPEKSSISHKHPAEKYQVPRRADESDGVHRRVLAADSLVFVWRRLGSYHPQLLLSGRRKPLNATHGTATAMQLSKSWAFPLCFGSIPWFSSRLADRAGGEIVIATAMIFFEEPPPGYAVPWSVSVGVAVAPVATRWGSRFIASFGVVDSIQTAMWIASGMLAPWEHAMQVG